MSSNNRFDSFNTGQIDHILQLQIDLGTKLNTSSDLDHALVSILETMLHVPGIDSGAIHLVDIKTNKLQLKVHEGYSPEFIEVLSSSPADLPCLKQVFSGETVHGIHSDLGSPALSSIYEKEGIKTLVIIPIVSMGDIIASCHLTSHAVEDISDFRVQALEVFAAQSAGVIKLFQVGSETTRYEPNFQSLFKSARNFGVVTIDLDCRITYYNSVARNFFNYPEEGVIVKPIHELHGWTEQESRIFKEVVNVVKNGGEYSYYVKLQSGEDILFLESLVSGIYDHHKKLTGYCFFYQDVTIFKKALEELHKREQYMQALNQTSSILLSLTDTVPYQEILGIIGEVSQASRAYIYVNQPQGMNKPIAKLVSQWLAEDFQQDKRYTLPLELDLSRSLPRWNKILSKGDIIKGHSKDFPGKEKKILQERNVKALLILPLIVDSKFFGFIGFENCISGRCWENFEIDFISAVAKNLSQAIEHRINSQTLYETYNHLEATLNALPDLLFEIDRNGHILDFRAPDPELLYKLPSEFLNKTVEEVLPSNVATIIMQAIRKASKTGECKEVTYSLDMKGETKWFELSIAAKGGKKGRKDGFVALVRDITRRKQVEDALRKYSLAIEQYPCSIIITDVEGNIEYVNPRFIELTGYEFEEVQGKVPGFLSPTGTTPDQYGKLWESIRNGNEWKGEFQNKKKDGRLFWENVYISPIRDPDGNITHFIAINEEITEKKHAEKALEISEQKFRRLVEYNPVGICVHAGGKIEYMNPKALEMAGATSEKDVLGKSIFDFVHPDYQQMVKQRLKMIQAENATAELMEEKFLRLDGSPFDVMALGIPITIGEDKPATLVVFFDISERKQAEESLRESEERFRTLFDKVSDSILLLKPHVDKSPTIIDINLSGCIIHGHPNDDVVGKPLDYLYDDTDTRTEIIRHLNSFEESGSINFEIIKSSDDKPPVTFEMSARYIQLKGEKYILLIERDVTERRHYEQELLKNEKLQSIGVLAGGIGHDFNNILTGILGNISLAKISINPNSEVYNILESAEKATLRASGLTQRLLTFSKGGTPVREPAQILENIKESTEFALAGSNVRCKFMFPDNLYTVKVDKGQFSQVIQNLAINAEQAMPNGGTLDVSVENVNIEPANPYLLKPGKYVKIIFSDEGTGISNDHLNKIFDPFFTTKQKGSGLGLATSYAIIGKHDGHIEVESTLGKGTKFTIYLPACDSRELKDKEPTGISQDENGKCIKPNQGKILVMDDEDIIREFLSRTLAKAGYEVYLAENAVKTIEMFRKALKSAQPFDLVILDLTIPGGTGGVETLKKLRELDPCIKAIVCSGYSNDPVIANHEEYGFQAALMKPFNINDLYKTVNKLAVSK